MSTEKLFKFCNMSINTFKEQVKLVKSIGDEIGYGHLMCIASALWRKNLKNHGVPLEGAFIPTIEYSVKKTDLKHIQKDKELYDSIIEKSLSGDEENKMPQTEVY